MRTFLFYMILFGSFSLFGQISEPILPRSFGLKRDVLLRHVNAHNLPALDNNVELSRAAKIKSETCSTCRKGFYGKGIDVDLDLKAKARQIELPDGAIWVLHVKSKTAKGLQFHFGEFNLPEGATLHIYSTEINFIQGAFTKKNNNPDGKFATGLFPSNEVVLEYFEPKTAKGGRLVISRVIHVFDDSNSPYSTQRDGIDPGYGHSGSCTINVKCPDGDPVATEAKAVALISEYDDRSGLASWCSGFLINTTNSNDYRKAYFMTAGHCISITKAPGYFFDFIFYFNYESSTCTNQLNSPLYSAMSFQGAFLKSMSDDYWHLNDSDYGLLELADKPETWLPVSYLGWDRTAVPPTGTVYNISHPYGDAKKVAVGNGPLSTDFMKYKSCLDETLQVWELSWNSGVTQPISSGSPLINGSKRVVGCLHGGVSRCNDSPPDESGCNETSTLPGPDFFCRLDYAWDHPGMTTNITPYNFNPLYSFLDETMTGLQFVDTYEPQPPVVGGGNPQSCVRQAGDSYGIRLSPEDDFVKWFGGDVSIDGSYIIVGAYKEKRAYIYKIEGCTVNLKYILKNDDDNNFGFKVDISGDYAIVGGEGHAYIYGRTGEDWSLINQFTSPHGGVTNYGCDVAISSGHAMVGAKTDGYGAVYFYKIGTGGSWSYETSYSGEMQGDDFGETVEIDGNRAIISATGFDNTSTGKVYILSYANSVWNIEKIIGCPNCAGGDNFGADLALHGNDFLVTSSVGAKVWSYKKKSGVWSENGMLTAPNQSHAYGSSVALTNQLTLVGDIGPDGSYTGSVNIFQRNSSDQKWIFLKSITVSGGAKAGDFFGYAVALTDSYCVVGRPESGTNSNGSCLFSGSVYVYDLGTIGAYSTASDINLCSLSQFADSYNIVRNATLGGTSSCSVVFNSGSNAGYFATGQVLIKTGVLVKSGATFQTKSTTGCVSFNTSTAGNEGGRISSNQISSIARPQNKIETKDESIELLLNPNPTSGKLALVLSDTEFLVSIRIITPLGGQYFVKPLKTEGDRTQYEIDISEYSAGIFLVEITTNKRNSYVRVLKI